MLAAFYIKNFQPRKFFDNGLLENSWIPCTCSIAFKSKETISLREHPVFSAFVSPADCFSEGEKTTNRRPEIRLRFAG